MARFYKECSPRVKIARSSVVGDGKGECIYDKGLELYRIPLATTVKDR